MIRPDWVTNESNWKKHCRRVVARGNDLLAGKLSVIACAQEMVKLVFWLRAESDADFMVFIAIKDASDAVPKEEDRKNWSGAKDERQFEITTIEQQWRKPALAAAEALIAKYEEAESKEDDSLKDDE
ncbi:hypothetical protein [Dasania marina]|uniref:hypothetical protein n=1 Tax=Dasania marina TaxID=471499 RepID=UPI0030DD05E7|tara:strand:+ start:58497 stop:58877 length:381 start_codon:yes stop_codon:yes gene_type:complete